MKKLLFLASFALSASAALSATLPDVVAEGFLAFEGHAQSNYVMGRPIQPSDLRHRVVLLIHYDSSKLHEQLVTTLPLSQIDGFPHSATWDDPEFQFPRKSVTVLSFDGDKIDQKTFREALKSKLPDEKAAAQESQSLAYWAMPKNGFYNSLKIVGEPDHLAETPYAYVLDGKTATPLFKGKVTKDSVKQIRNAFSKALSELPDWTPLTGVEEVKFNKSAAKIIADGKAVQPALSQLRAAIKDKDPEKAKEAQIMYDALIQFRDDTATRIMIEAGQHPARAYADAMLLSRRFPQEKAKLKMQLSKLFTNKDAMSLGKMMEKIVEWLDPKYVCKNKTEVKKNIALMTGWKKQLEKLQNSQDSGIGGEASLLLSQLDGLIATMPDKIPQK